MLSQCFIFTILGFEFAVSLNTSTSGTQWWNLWTYEDESSWPGELCQMGGRRQSPINIKTSDVKVDFKNEFIKYGELQFSGYSQVLLTGVNNGHTIQFSTEGAQDMHPTMKGGPLEQAYRMEQLHFHYLSEHSIDDNKFPMEVHFVHVRAGLAVTDALHSRGGLAIVSVFVNVVKELNNEQFEDTYEFMQYIPRMARTSTRISGILLNTTKLLSPELRSYYTYEGSLTSPECNEVVIWIIFYKPIVISDAQYRMFSQINSGRHNFRRLQPVRWQQVFTPPPSSLWSPPYLVSVFSDAYNSVASFISNVNTIPISEINDACLQARQWNNAFNLEEETWISCPEDP